MEFNTPLFLGFFAAAAVINYALPRMLRPYFLLIASYGFFCYDPVNRPLVWVIAAATVVTWLCGLIIGKVKNNAVRVLALLVSVGFGIGILIYYKYWNLLADSLGGSRCAPWRHYLNIVIVFVCSGLWHGADWRYLAWGLFTGLLAAFGVMTAGARQRINRYNLLYRMGWFKVLWQCFFTNALFCLTLVFFASAIYNTDPFAVYSSLLQGWDGLSGSWAQVSNLIYSSGIDGRLPVVLLFGCFVVFAAEHGGRSVAKWIRQQVWPLRWTLYYGMAAAILFFAAFGQSAFIYQQY